MVVLLSTTIISCSQALGIVNRISKVLGLNYQQKLELIYEIQNVVPSCPIKIIKNSK